MLYETLSSSLKLDYNTSYTISYFIKLYFSRYVYFTWMTL